MNKLEFVRIEIFWGDIMSGIFLAAFSFVAALMGAGFASGQETVTFFAAFGHYGALGIIIASALIAAFCGVVSEYALRCDCDYGVIISDVFPCRIRRIIDAAMVIFAVCVESVMFACFGELVSSLTGMPVFVGALFACLLCSAAMLCKVENAIKINAVIGAVMFVAASAMCLYLLGYREHQTFSAAGAVSSGGIYAGYNLLCVGAVTVSGRMFLKKRGYGFLCGIASGIMIFVLMMLMWGIISVYYGKINLGELPMLTLALRESRNLAVAYSVVLSAAVLTTAFSNGLCAVEYVRGFIGHKAAVIIISAVGLALSGAGFSRLIDTAYRGCGVIGLVIAVWIVFKLIILIIKKEKQRF